LSREPAFSPAPSAAADGPAQSERWWGLNPSAVKGFVLWLLMMGFLLSLEKPMGTTWIRLGVPLLDPNPRPLDCWKPSQIAVLKWGLAVDCVNLAVYPLVLWSLLNSIALLRQRRGTCCAPCFRKASWVALLALPFDLAENLCLGVLLMQGSEPSGGFLRLLTVMSLLKLACAWVSFCWLALGLVLIALDRFRNSSSSPRSGNPTPPGPSAPHNAPASVVFKT
jgi:hypothetical protein